MLPKRLDIISNQFGHWIRFSHVGIIKAFCFAKNGRIKMKLIVIRSVEDDFNAFNLLWFFHFLFRSESFYWNHSLKLIDICWIVWDCESVRVCAFIHSAGNGSISVRIRFYSVLFSTNNYCQFLIHLCLSFTHTLTQTQYEYLNTNTNRTSHIDSFTPLESFVFMEFTAYKSTNRLVKRE